MLVVCFAAIAADKFGTPGADGQLRHQDLHLLTFAEDLGAETEEIFQLGSRRSCGGLQSGTAGLNDLTIG